MNGFTEDLVTNYPPATRGKLVVWGLLGAFPFGGMTWQALHHVAGLRRLGFDVWYVEDSDRPVRDAETWAPIWDCVANVKFLARYMDKIGLGDRWVFRVPGDAEQCYGALDVTGLSRLYREADAVLNVCGAQEWLPKHEQIQCLVYLETDPVEKQVQVAEGDQQVISMLDKYDYLFTYGENFGATDCKVPIVRYRWYPTRPPVCIDWWHTSNTQQENAPISTVMVWGHGHKNVVWNGEIWRWSKNYEFRRFVTLPLRVSTPFEVAVWGMRELDENLLRSHKWRIRSSSELNEPGTYRDYIRGSLAEFTACKEQVVKPRPGWFSDRSACYLAAGKPVVLQDTGFSNVLPTGEGLFSFATEDEAVSAIETITADYEKHSKAAAEIANQYFAAERVLGALLGTIGLM